jgi:hypothetical protein
MSYTTPTNLHLRKLPNHQIPIPTNPPNRHLPRPPHDEISIGALPRNLTLPMYLAARLQWSQEAGLRPSGNRLY